MATRNGIVKKVKTTEFANARARGVTAISFKESDDSLVSAVLTSDGDSVMIVSRNGKGLLIDGNSVRAMGRSAAGVRGINLRDGDKLAAAVSVKEGHDALIVTEFGYGKRAVFSDFFEHARGTVGQKIFGNIEERGKIVGAIAVSPNDELIAVTSLGKTLRVNVSELPLQSRIASGNKLVKVAPPDYVVSFDRVVSETQSDN